MRALETGIPDCFELLPDRKIDARGFFTKIFNADNFSQLGLETDFKEDYYSLSHKGVIRGLHFQEPPMDLVKLVICLDGAVHDILLDLRVDSPTYKKHMSFHLSAELGNMLYIPSGIAHGFQVVSETALMLYKVSQVYSSTHDLGVLWDSANIEWPIAKPIISERDAAFQSLDSYCSPFKIKSSSE